VEAPDAHGRTVRRVAFLTPEFVTDEGRTGGVGNYVLKMATALTARGVEAEVFVASARSEVVEYDGFRVESVAGERSLVVRGVSWLGRSLAGPQADAFAHVANARKLAAAVARRHAQRPFDAIQSSNYHLTGAGIPRAGAYRHLIRISTSRTLYDHDLGRRAAATSRIVEAYDAHVMRRADAVYAPSKLLADHFRATHGLDVAVLRPPAELGEVPARDLPFALPPRYLLHFGSLGSRKGTDVVARALPLAWQVEPDLRMVWIGPLPKETLAAYRHAWGDRADQVAVLGTVDKSITYGVLKRAVASVLPSSVDNLPNTVIESLILGVPVIGSDGASIDELVEDGRSGALVPIGDASALARAMNDAWSGRAGWLGAGFREPPSLADMHTDRAVEAFLRLARQNAPATS
jgi:glycogen synthase